MQWADVWLQPRIGAAEYAVRGLAIISIAIVALLSIAHLLQVVDVLLFPVDQLNEMKYPLENESYSREHWEYTSRTTFVLNGAGSILLWGLAACCFIKAWCRLTLVWLALGYAAAVLPPILHGIIGMFV